MRHHSPPRSRPGGHHRAEVIQAGERCPVQPTDGREFTKRVSVNGSIMEFRQAQLAGFLTWQHPVPLGQDRSYAIWTEKAEQHNRRPAIVAPQPRPPVKRRETPAFGLSKPE